MRKDQVKLSRLQAIPALIFTPTFGNHMTLGDRKGQRHAGLHILSAFQKANGQALAVGDIIRNQSYTGQLNGRQTQITIKDVDSRAKTFCADVNIYGSAKSSTFFPIGTSLAQAKSHIEEAWRDHCTYGTAAYGGGDVDVYRQMRARFRLNWVGMSRINGQQIWVGSAHAGSVDTAFSAVNNKFT